MKRSLLLLTLCAPMASPHGARAAVDAAHYDLTLKVDPQTLAVEASAAVTVRAAPGGGPVTTVELDLVGLTVTSVTWEGQAISFERVGEVLTAELPAPLPEGQQGVLAVAYRGVPEPYVTEQGDLGLMQDRGITFNINVTEGARYWFPCRDRLDDKASVELRLVVPPGSVTAGPGHLVEVSGGAPGEETHHWSMSQPVTPYLIGFAFSNLYERHTEQLELATGEVTLDVALTGATWDTAGLALSVVPDILDWLQGRYGAFPYDQAAFHEIPFPGAVEQPGNVAMGSFYFAEDPRLLIYFAHELSHSWFQGKVTIRSWDDIWLSEGAAAWHELLWTEEADGQAAADEMAAIYTAAYGAGIPSEGLFPLSEPEVVFGYTTYMKGPVVWRLLEHLMGRQELLEVLRAYHRDPDGVADLDEFVALVEEAAVPGTEHFREEWLDRAGLAAYDFAWQAAPSGERWGLAVQLGQGVPLYRTPIDVEVGLADGSTVTRTLAPDSDRFSVLLCFDQEVTSVALDPRRMVPRTPDGVASVMDGDPSLACVEDPPDGGCGRLPAREGLSLLGAGMLAPLVWARRRRR